MQHAGLQYGQGAANSHQSPPFAHAADISQSSGGNTTSSLRQFRKKDGADKQTGSDLNVGENIARVAPHSHYPARPNTDYYRYHQYPDYSSPYKEAPTGPPVKYSEIAEPPQVQPPSIQHVDPVHAIQKQHHKDKEFMDMCNISQQAVQHMKAHQVAAYQDGGMNRAQQGYGHPDAASMYLHNKEQQMHGYKAESQYAAQQYAHAKYNMTAPPQCARKYAPPPPSQQAPLENDFLAKLQRLNPSIARSIMSDHHIRESQYSPVGPPQYAPPPLQPHPSHPSHPPPPPQNQRYYPNYYYPYNSSCNYPSRGGGNGGAAPQPNNRQYDRPPSPRRMYHHQDYQNVVVPPQKISPQYPQPYGGTPEYAQHYQHRRVPPQEFYRNAPQVSPSESDNRASSGLRDYIQNWNIGEEEPPPSAIQPMEPGGVAPSSSVPAIPVTSSGASEQLYVINSSEISPQCLESLSGVSLIPTENGQYILKPTGIDSSLVRINIDKTSEEHSVNLQIVEAASKNDCMLEEASLTDLVQQASPIKDMPLIDDLGNEDNSATESEETDDSPEKPETEEEEPAKKKIFSVDDIINKKAVVPEEETKSEDKREESKNKESVAATTTTTTTTTKENEEVHAISVENDSIIIEIGGAMVQLNISHNNGSKVLSVVSLTESLIIDVNGNYSREDREETKDTSKKASTENATEEMKVPDTEEVSSEAREETSQETCEEVSKEACEEVSKEACEEVSKEACEEVSKEAHEEASEERCEETSIEACEKAAQEAAAEVSENNSEEASEELPAKISENVSEEVVEDTGVTKDVSERFEDEIEKSKDKAEDTSSERLPEMCEKRSKGRSQKMSGVRPKRKFKSKSEDISVSQRFEDGIDKSKDTSERLPEVCEEGSKERSEEMFEVRPKRKSKSRSEDIPVSERFEDDIDESKDKSKDTSERIPEVCDEGSKGRSEEMSGARPKRKSKNRSKYISEKRCEEISEKPKETTRERSRRKSKRKSQDIFEDRLELSSVTEEPPQQTSEERSEKICAQRSEECFEEKSRATPEISEEKSKGMLRKRSVDMSKEKSEERSMSERSSTDVKSKQMSERSEEILEERPGELCKEKISEERPEAMSEEISEVVPEARSPGTTDEIPEGMIEERSEGMLEERSEGIIEERSEGTTEEGSEGIIEESSETIPGEISKLMTEERSEAMTEDRSKAVTEDRSEAVTEETLEPLTEVFLVKKEEMEELSVSLLKPNLDELKKEEPVEDVPEKIRYQDIEDTLKEIGEGQTSEILLEMDEVCQNEIVIGEEIDDVPLFELENTDEEIRRRSEEIVANLMRMKQQQEEILEKSALRQDKKLPEKSSRRKSDAPKSIPISVKLTDENMALRYGIENEKKLAVTLEKLRPEDIRHYNISEESLTPKKKFREMVTKVVKKIDNKRRPCSASKAEERSKTKKKKRNLSEENQRSEETEENRRKESVKLGRRLEHRGEESRRSKEDNSEDKKKESKEIGDGGRRIGRRRFKNLFSEDDSRNLPEQLGRSGEETGRIENNRTVEKFEGSKKEIRNNQSEESRINETSCRKIDEEMVQCEENGARKKRSSEERPSEESSKSRGKKVVELGKKIEEIGRKCAERRNEEKVEKRLKEAKIGSVRRKTREFDRKDLYQNEERVQTTEDCANQIEATSHSEIVIVASEENKAREGSTEEIMVASTSKEENVGNKIEESTKPQVKKREEDVRIKKKNSCTMCIGCKHDEAPPRQKRRSEEPKKKDGSKKIKLDESSIPKIPKKPVIPKVVEEKKDKAEEKEERVVNEDQLKESEDRRKKEEKRKVRKSIEETKPKVVEEKINVTLLIEDDTKTKRLEKMKKLKKPESRVFSTKAAKKLYVSDINSIPIVESGKRNEDQVLLQLDEAIKGMEHHEERVKKPKRVTFALVPEDMEETRRQQKRIEETREEERRQREETRRQEEKKKLSWAEYHSRRKKVVNGADVAKIQGAKQQSEEVAEATEAVEEVTVAGNSEEATEETPGKKDENFVDVLETVEMSIENDIRANDGINMMLETELGTAYEMVQKVYAQAYASSDYSYDEAEIKDGFEERDCFDATNPEKPDSDVEEEKEVSGEETEGIDKVSEETAETVEVSEETVEEVREEAIEEVAIEEVREETIEEVREVAIEEVREVAIEEVSEVAVEVREEAIEEVREEIGEVTEEVELGEIRDEEVRIEETSMPITSTPVRSTPKMDNSWEDDDDEEPQPSKPKRGVFIDANEFDIKPVSSSFPEDDTLQNYKDVVDLKLSSLSIQIPKPKPKSDPEVPIGVLLERFLSKGLLDCGQLERVKRIIEYKRKIEEEENQKAAARKYQYEVYQNGRLGGASSTSSEQIKMSIRRVSSSEETKKKKRRFRNLNAITSDEDDDEEDQEYSVYQRTGTGVPKLIFKRKPGLPQPYVKLERSQTAELLVKKRKLY